MHEAAIAAEMVASTAHACPVGSVQLVQGCGGSRKGLTREEHSGT